MASKQGDPIWTYGWTNSIQAKKCVCPKTEILPVSEIQTWAHIFFLDWTFLSLIFGQEDCLASLRSADNCPPSLRSRKGKSNLGKKCSPLFVFRYRQYYVTRTEDTFLVVRKNRFIEMTTTALSFGNKILI